MLAGRGRRGWFVGLGLALVLVLGGCSSIERLTADQTTDRAALWLYASDVAPGDAVDAHVELDGGLELAITSVVIRGTGDVQVVAGREPEWDTVIKSKLGADEGHDEMDLEIEIPRGVKPGVLLLQIDVQYVVAEGGFVFTNESKNERFLVEVPIRSATASTWRRAGKLALALASWAAVVVLVVRVRRWYGRRDRPVSSSWHILFVPHAVLGWFWFSTLLEHATRLHGWWMVVLCLVIWYLAFAVAYRLGARDRECRYAIVQARLPVADDAAYRGSGATVPSVDVHVLEEAWRTAGSVVERTPNALLVTHHRGRARIPIPVSERFGAGETFEILSDDEAAVISLVEAAASVLGELRWQLVSRGALEGAPRAAP